LFDILHSQGKLTVEPGLHLLYSVFGWLIVGRKLIKKHTPLPVLVDTSKAISQISALDILGITDEQLYDSCEEESALNNFCNTIQFENNRYIV